MLYLVHFAERYEHAGHYLGFVRERDEQELGAEEAFTRALEARLRRHENGHGSRLLAVVTDAGIPWWVVRIWPGMGRNEERRLKGHSSTRYCPHPNCSGQLAWNRGTLGCGRGGPDGVGVAGTPAAGADLAAVLPLWVPRAGDAAQAERGDRLGRVPPLRPGLQHPAP